MRIRVKEKEKQSLVPRSLEILIVLAKKESEAPQYLLPGASFKDKVAPVSFLNPVRSGLLPNTRRIKQPAAVKN